MVDVDKEKEAEQQAKVAEQEKAKKEAKDEKDVDYWRQQAQQNDANARRERQTREENEKAALDTKTQLTQATEKLADLEQKLEQQAQFQKMDKDIVDPAVASNIEALQKQIETLTGNYNSQQAKITQYEQLETQREQGRQYDQAVESICKPLDDKYGQKYRSEARDLADKAVEDGSEKKPQTTLEAYLLHEKYYKQLSEKKPSKKSTSTDTGKETVLVKGRKDGGKFTDVLQEMKDRCKT
jgi:phage-related minor tail protein